MTARSEGADAPGPWQTARVLAVRRETVRMKTFRFCLERQTPYLPGRRFLPRLTALAGYRGRRSSSAPSAPDAAGRTVELTVERLDGGEVSTFLNDDLAVGDELEIRGPIGGRFAWRGELPILLVGPGARRAYVGRGRHARRPALRRRTRGAGGDGGGYAPPAARRVPAGRAHRSGRPRPPLRPSAFCDCVTDMLASLGHDPGRIRVERFGPGRGPAAR